LNPLDVKLPPEHRPVFSLGHNGRLLHTAGERIDRHRHLPSFIAVVLRGAYIEAGDSGYLKLTPGDVAVHGPREAHINRVDSMGAEVLLLPNTAERGCFGRVADPDAIVRMAERNTRAAAEQVETELVISSMPPEDWPQMLAQELIARPCLGLAAWAAQHHLRPETVSRGFQQVFGCSPKEYRASVRAHRAWRDLKPGSQALKDIAAECGFSDQGHMSREIARLTGRAPKLWRS
jgi:AraC-like DNA-binding protein